MSDTESTSARHFPLGPRLARLVGSQPGNEQDRVELRPVQPGVAFQENTIAEPDQPYASRTSHTDNRQEETQAPVAAEQLTIAEQIPTPLNTPANTLQTDEAATKPESPVNATLPDKQTESDPSQGTPEKRNTPQQRVLQPLTLSERILTETANRETAPQPENTTATKIPEPPKSPADSTKTSPEPPAIPARERIVEQIFIPAPGENAPRFDNPPDGDDTAPEESTEKQPGLPQADSETPGPVQSKLTNVTRHVPDFSSPEMPPEPVHPSTPQLIPIQAEEPVEPLPQRAFTEKKTEQRKPPVRIEIGALNITLRQPDPPPVRPALSVARKAPRAHTIPLHGFREN